LIEQSGMVERDRAAQVGQFTAAAQGAHFDSGDGLRTAPDAHARLRLGRSGSVVVQSDTTIRLWRGGHRGFKLKVQTGDASVVAAEAPIEIETELGIAVLQAGSALRVHPSKRGQRYEVTMGRAILTAPDGQQTTLAAGESIGVDKAAEERGNVVPPASSAPDAATPPPAASADVLPTSAGPGDVSLGLTASATIFDPRPPTAVGVDVGATCPNGGELSLRGRKPIAIEQQQTLSLGPGAYDYKLACLDGQGRSAGAPLRGTLHVVRNPGTAQLLRSAPKNSIEADGRTYTIMFQNLLPVLEVRWPDAPPAPGYSLRAQLDNGKELRIELKQARYVFKAGVLPEGRHQLQFEVDGGARSKPTTVDLRYDNASPGASLRAPLVTGFEPGTTVHVAGVALPGSQVSVLGQRLSLDGQQRFSGDVQVPPGTQAIAVRIQHPRTGLRYYVRRARSGP
jgi:hypothetical protein